MGGPAAVELQIATARTPCFACQAESPTGTYNPPVRSILIALVSALSWWDPAAIRPQQRGVCITEWEGGQRREIPVVVMGTLDATSPDREAVLVRLDDPAFAGGGVVAGMSGSPVYVDGKLLGAVAFGWSFAHDPLAGVTPFARMSAIAVGGPAPSAPQPTLAAIAGVVAGSVAPAAVLPALSGDTRRGLLPVAVGGLPLPSGFAADVLSRAALAGIPAGTVATPSGPPEAGEMIAALLVWGDATLAAGGTVTARDGDRIWAFGHPFFSLGNVHIPAARARVIAVQSSYQSSFKVFGVGPAIGAFIADRPAGMLAEVGPVPPGLPLAITVRDASGESSWSFRIAQVPMLEPLLATFLANSCLTARGASNGEATVRLRLELGLADGSRVAVEQSTRGIDALARVSTFVGAAVAYLENSSFPHPAITSLRAELERQENAFGANLSEAIPDRTTVHPGETVTVTVTLQPDRGQPEQRRLAVAVPRDQPVGAVDLIVADGSAWSEYRLRAEGLAAASFADEVEQLAMLESASTLVAALESKERGIARPGVSQPALPPSWSATLATGLGVRGVTRLSTVTVATARWNAPYPLVGAFRIPLTVLPQPLEAQ